jgi:YHS domain-containing protein
MKPYLTVALLLASAYLAAASLLAAPASTASAAACPVTGRPIDKAVSIDYLGARLYFAESACIAKFQAEPARYTVGANYQLAVTGQARQVACPFTGKAVNSSVPTAKVGVLDIGFCCHACQQTVARAADIQAKYRLVFGDAFATGFVVEKK